jgi:RNA polymerase sigma factor (sigma-70 family)
MDAFMKYYRPVVLGEATEGGACWAEVAEGIRIGDNSAVERLYAALSDGPCLGIFRRLDPQFAQDRVHEVMVIVIEAIRGGALRDPDRLMGFVWVVARRRAAALIRGASFQRRRLADATQQEPRTPRDESPEARASAREQRDGVKRMLARLKVRDREILERFYYGEQAAEQICSEMHLTPTQFRLYKSRAIARCGDIARRARPRYQSTNPF